MDATQPNAILAETLMERQVHVESMVNLLAAYADMDRDIEDKVSEMLESWGACHVMPSARDMMSTLGGDGTKCPCSHVEFLAEAVWERGHVGTVWTFTVPLVMDELGHCPQGQRFVIAYQPDHVPATVTLREVADWVLTNQKVLTDDEETPEEGR